jgi:hypothetical protein
VSGLALVTGKRTPPGTPHEGRATTDAPDCVENVKRWSKVDNARRFAYSGTAKDRNVHMMSGRVI